MKKAGTINSVTIGGQTFSVSEKPPVGPWPTKEYETIKKGEKLHLKENLITGKYDIHEIDEEHPQNAVAAEEIIYSSATWNKSTGEIFNRRDT